LTASAVVRELGLAPMTSNRGGLQSQLLTTILKEGADEMAKLTQTLVHQQKVIEALTKRISALEGTDS